MFSYNPTCIDLTAIFRENINIDMYWSSETSYDISTEVIPEEEMKLKNVGSEFDISETTYLVDCIVSFIFTIFWSKPDNSTSLAHGDIIISHNNCAICFKLDLF